MRRLPIAATLVVAAAVAAMITLGFWQLARGAQKDRMLAEYSRATRAPVLDLDPLTSGPLPGGLAFRRVMISCRPARLDWERVGGRSRDGRPGWRHLLPCRPDEPGWAGGLSVDHGWAASPRMEVPAFAGGLVAGVAGRVGPQGRIVLTAASARPPLLPSAPPDPSTVPNSHLGYAIQWFAFAAIAALIYALALRARLRRRAPDPRSAPL